MRKKGDDNDDDLDGRLLRESLCLYRDVDNERKVKIMAVRRGSFCFTFLLRLFFLLFPVHFCK
jgi:hypothetical protein